MIQILTNPTGPSTKVDMSAPVRKITRPVVLAQFRNLGIPVSDLIDLSLAGNEVIKFSVFAGWGYGVLMFHDSGIPDVLGSDLTELAWQLDNSGILQDVQEASRAVDHRLHEDWVEVPTWKVPDDAEFSLRDSLYARDLSFFSLEKHLGRKPDVLLPSPVYYKRKGDSETSNTYICIRRGWLSPTTDDPDNRIVIETTDNGDFADFNLFSNLIRHKYVFERYGIKTTSD